MIKLLCRKKEISASNHDMSENGSMYCAASQIVTSSREALWLSSTAQHVKLTEALGCTSSSDHDSIITTNKRCVCLI